METVHNYVALAGVNSLFCSLLFFVVSLLLINLNI